MVERRKKHQVNMFIITILLILVLFLFYGNGAYAAESGTVYASIERFTLGQGYLVEPVAISFNKGENYAEIFDRIAKNNQLIYTADRTMGAGKITYFYLRSIDNADTGVLDIPDIILNMEPLNYGGVKVYPPTNTVNDGNEDSFPSLGEFAYGSLSGWYYLVNNKNPGIGFAGLEPQDGDVVRFQFTLFGIGGDVENKALPNRDAITKRLAIMNFSRKELYKYGYQDIYNKAVKVVEDFDSDQKAMDNAYASLPSDTQIKNCKDAYNVENMIDSIGTVSLAKESQIAKVRSSYNALSSGAKNLILSSELGILIKAENRLAALKQEKKTVEASKKILDKVKISKLTAGNKKVVIKWKKLSSDIRYEIYMSAKKRTGYKKIATIKKPNKLTYTKKKLKSRKKYYFRIRAYRKIRGKTYYGKFSPVKQVRTK